MHKQNEDCIVEVKKMLDSAGIDYSPWGSTPSTKSVTFLAKEVEEHESELVFTDGQLVRQLSVLYVHVRYGRKVLVEDYSEWKDGRGLRRRKLPGSLAEKMKIGESWQAAAVRALQEELGVEIPEHELGRFTQLNLEQKNEDSLSFPGLQAAYTNYHVSIEFSDNEHCVDGYVEHDSVKTTYFVWRE